MVIVPDIISVIMYGVQKRESSLCKEFKRRLFSFQMNILKPITELYC